MPRLSLCLLAALSLAPPPDARSDDKPPQALTFEAVLSEKGLKRFGLSYILKDTEQRDRQNGEYASALERLEGEFRPLFAEKSRLEQNIKYAKDEIERRRSERDRAEQARAEYDRISSDKSKSLAERGQAYLNTFSSAGDVRGAEMALSAAEGALSRFEDEHREDFRVYKEERGRLQGAIRALVAETAAIYASLARDPAVKEAIRTHNSDRRPKVVLGPVASREDYLARVRDDDIALLRDKGVVFNPERKRFVVAVENQVGALASKAEMLLTKLEEAEKRARGGTNSRRAELLAKREKAVAELAGAPLHRKQQEVAKLKMIDDQLRRLPPDDVEADVKRRAAEFVEARKMFLSALQALREAADQAPLARRAMEGDPEVRAILAGLTNNKGPTKLAAPLSYHQGLGTLAKLEKAIRVDRVPRGNGPDGESTVGVVLNGRLHVPMVIDPEARATLLPAALADAVGASPAPDAPEVAVPVAGGGPVKARRSRLRSVQVGGSTIEGVTCLVLPADAPGRAVPVLGTDVLDHFAWEVPFGGAELILTQVIPSHASREAKTARP
jgi:hypothetical protein